MDKYELSIKEDKIKKHVENKDYETAAKIADTIDWSRVKNAKMLTMISQVYEKVGNYPQAKAVLVYAYEHLPVGRRMLYKLTELSVKAGDIKDAEEFFEEFQEVAPNDNSKLILAYLIGAATGEPIDKLISILEFYRKSDFEEKWAYELAELYHKAGKSKECVQLCNEIILWFSVGPYVDKAMDLKMLYEPLTPQEQEKLDNKKKFEDRLAAVEAEFARIDEAKGLNPSAGEDEATEEAVVDETEEALATMQESLAAMVRGELHIPEKKHTNAPLDEMATQEIPVFDAVGVTAPAFDAPSEPEASGNEEAQAILDLLAKATEEDAGDSGLQISADLLPETDADTKNNFVDEVRKALEKAVAPQLSQGEDLLEEDITRMQDGIESQNMGVEAAILDEVTAALAASTMEIQNSIEEEKEAPAEVTKEVPATAEMPAEPEFTVVLPEEPEMPVEAEIPVVIPEMPAEPEVSVVIPEMPAEPEVSVVIPEMPAESELSAEMPAEAPIDFDIPEEAPAAPANAITCVVIEEEDTEQRITIAVEKLKKTHEILGMPATKVAKISGSKLNSKGVNSTLERLAGRDLIIDYAADLSTEAALELAAEIENPSCSMVVLLVDTSERINDFLMDNPSLDKHCLYLEDDTDTYEDVPLAEAENAQTETAEEELDERNSTEAFIAMLKEFAFEEECVLDKGGEEALAALAEQMRNAGSILDESTARTILEEAIEKAEHRGIKGFFISKYDKEGYLILKADCFPGL